MSEDQIRIASDKLALRCLNEIREYKADSPKAQIRKVIEEVCERHDVNYNDIMSKSRFAHIVAARHEAIVRVAAAFPWMSLPKLGRVFGRDHTSIMHALDKFGVPRRSEGHEGRQQSYRTHALALGRIMRQLGDALNAAQSESLEVEIQEPASQNSGRLLRFEEGTPGLDEPETQGTGRRDNPVATSSEVQARV